MKGFLLILVFLFAGTTYVYADDNDYSQMEVLFLASDNLEFDEYQNLSLDASPIFNVENAAPGDSVTKYIKILNNSNDPIDYLVQFNITETSDIEEVIYIDIDLNNERVSLLGSSLEQYELIGREIGRNESVIYKITIRIDENADNRYNRKDEELLFKFDMKCLSFRSNTDQVLPLSKQYFGSVHSRNWIKEKDSLDGFAEMTFPKIQNGWTIENGKLKLSGDEIDIENGLLLAPIGIKTESLLELYTGYKVSSVRVNGLELLNEDQIGAKWVESTYHWDLMKGYSHQIYLKVGSINGQNFEFEPTTYEIQLTISNNDHNITFLLEVEITTKGNN